jgi:hypothetical protein
VGENTSTSMVAADLAAADEDAYAEAFAVRHVPTLAPPTAVCRTLRSAGHDSRFPARKAVPPREQYARALERRR